MTKGIEHASIIGIDGCKGGWCCSYAHQGAIRTIVIETIEQLVTYFPFAKQVLIDIPIGLESKTHKRDLDQFARVHLKPNRTSSLFTPPARDALNAANYQEACEVNHMVTGKKISIQSWNISEKIRETDHFIRSNQAFKSIVHEAHPEICFKYLNNGKLPTFRKQEKGFKGIKERLTILSKYNKDVFTSFEFNISKYDRSIVKPDDVVDSMCLYTVANLGDRYGFSKITGCTLKDEYDIDLNLYFVDVKNHSTK